MSTTKIGKDDMAIEGAANQTLKKDQVRDLILSAQTAYHVQAKLGMADESFDVWRKAALHDAAGKASFRAVTQREYGKVLAYFVTLAGKKPETRRAAVKPQGADDADRARWSLDNECRKQSEVFGSYEGARTYAEVLLGKIHKTTVTGATAKQLWQVMFTVRNRARAKMRSDAL